MELTVPTKPLTFRIENIPPGTTAEELIQYFYTEDQPRIRVRSIAPAVDNYELDIREYTATVSFQTVNQSVLSPRLLDEDISVDCDFHGFTPLNHPQEPIAADIIAVTGLAAHAFGSWAHSAHNMWLRDYLPRDINNARVLIYGYPSQLHGNISRSILSDHSTNMIHRLLTMRETAKCQDRPIIFIGHSLGCLIIKKALCDINGSVGIYRSRLPVRSIVFLGAPHKGLETTALETLVKSQATEDMIRELKSESPTLTELNDKFRHVAKDIDILTCYELSPTKTAVEMSDGTWKREGTPIMMVPLDSARQWYPREEFVACNADHSQIAKLKRGENSIYPSVRWAIKKALLSAGDLYSEAKGTHPGGPHNLDSADAALVIRKSLLQVARRHSSLSSNYRIADAAPTPSRSPSEDIVGQQIRHLPRVQVDQSAQPGDTQSKSDLFNETVSGIKVSEWEHTRSPADRIISAESDKASVFSDEDNATSNGTELMSSLNAEDTTSKDIREERSPDLVRKSVNENVALPIAHSHVPTTGAKSMTMDNVMESAITEGDEAKTRELLASRYDVNCKNRDCMTPLLLAARYRHENVLRLLLEQGANPRAQCDEGKTTLHWLGSTSEAPITETLIDLLFRDRPPFEVADWKGITPLMIACSIGKFLLAMRLIRYGADVRATDKDGFTALHHATYHGRVQIITLLMDQGAELEMKTCAGYTPLQTAVTSKSDNSDAVGQLLRHGADKEAVGVYSRSTPLHLAVRSHNKACVTCLLESGVNLEAEDRYLFRPLHYAARDGQLEITQVLLDRGANIEAQTADERPLHLAAENGHLQIVKVLLDHGANIEARDTWGQRPLHLATCYGHIEIVKALLSHGADPTARTTMLVGSKPSGMSVDYSVSSTQEQAIRALLNEAEKNWKESKIKEIPLLRWLGI